MTIKDQDPYKKDEEEIVLDASAVVSNAGGKPNEPPIPAGHSRFYCEKCHTVSAVLFLLLFLLLFTRYRPTAFI